MSKSAVSDPDPLTRYNAKRDFTRTSEPVGSVSKRPKRKGALQFIVQKHWASRLHYDFRLELDGVMLSWAVPKGPSFDPSIKRMAIRVEDHPVSYNEFEGSIPRGSYGAGKVILWERGTWEPIGDPREGFANGKLVFRLHGQKLAGVWELVRTSSPAAKAKDQWLLFKKRGDAWARSMAEYDVIAALPDSVVDTPLGLAEERESERGRLPDGSSPCGARPDLSAAVKAKLPARLTPQLATLVSAAPDGDWVVETKLDGYRMLARVERGKVHLYTRNGHDWTSKLEGLAQQVATLDVGPAWLDGEIVVLNAEGVPDFNALQKAIDRLSSDDIVYFLFDAPFLGGKDLRQVPLTSRRAVLRDALVGSASQTLRFNESFDVPAAQMLDAASRMGLEGVMLKRPDATYVSSRTETWLKLKCARRQEFVVIGFTDRANDPREVGSLLLGYHEDGKLRFGGAVGTGWSARTGAELRSRLGQLVIAKAAVDPGSATPGRWARRAASARHWVRPQTVVEVAFGEWTPEGHVRHAKFQGIRTDRPARSVTRERPVSASGASTSATTAARRPSIQVTHPERVIDPSTGTRKIQLVRFYESIAGWMLPHLRGRPVSLVRAPEGIEGQLFFQKHLEGQIPGVTELDAALWPDHPPLLSIDSIEALMAAAQMNVVEFHTWNSTAKSIEKPDRAVFDLDPGEGVSWSQLQEAAVLTRAMLRELGLESWLKTSGGKGLHVVVPLAPRFEYDTVKGFSQALAQHMACTIPQRFVAKSGSRNRLGRIFIDYLRNGRAQTTVAAFSARARPGMGVSMPMSWEQLASIDSGHQWTVATAREYLSFQKIDPWADYWKAKQPLAAAMRQIGFKPDRRK